MHYYIRIYFVEKCFSCLVDEKIIELNNTVLKQKIDVTLECEMFEPNTK